MVGRANEDMLPRLKRMWQACFDDTREGMEFVFSNLLTPSQMLVRTLEDGRPVSMISWKLLPFTTPRASFLGAYVFGVATLPEHRGKGISRTMMSGLHSILQQEGANLACLVPAQPSLFPFYEEQGYQTAFSYRLLSVDAGQLPPSDGNGVLSRWELGQAAELRNQFFSSCSLFGAWDKAYLRFLDKECGFYGGEVLRFSTAGRGGYLVCYPHGAGRILVKEAAVMEQDIPVLLTALHQRYAAKGYDLRLPVRKGEGEEPLPFAMVKWYDKEKEGLAKGGLGGSSWFAFGLD